MPASSLEKMVKKFNNGNIGKDEMLEILSIQIRKTKNLSAAKLYCDLQGWTKTTIKEIPQISLSFGSEIMQEALKEGEEEK